MPWMCSMSLLIYRSCKVQEQGGKGRKSGEKGTGSERTGKRGTGIGRFWSPCPSHKKADPNLSWRQYVFPETSRHEWLDDWMTMSENEWKLHYSAEVSSSFLWEKANMTHLWLLFSFVVIKQAAQDCTVKTTSVLVCRKIAQIQSKERSSTSDN